MKGSQCVYVMKSGQFYKIGRSNNLDRRVKTIRDTHHPQLLSNPVVIHTIATEQPGQLEQQLHRIFRPLRVVGEWFLLGDDAVAWLCAQTEHIENAPTFSKVEPIRNDDDITCLKLPEAAAMLGVEESVIREWIERREITCIRFSPRSYRVTVAEVRRIQSGLG